MRLLNTNEAKWDKNIKLELTLRELQIIIDSIGVIKLELALRELQIIRDSIGVTSHNMRTEAWNDDFKDCPYNSEQVSSLFDDVNYILKEQRGVTFE